MESAGTSVAAGAPEQLDPAYQLDLDPTAEFADDGLDFTALDGSYEDLEHIMEEDMGMGHDAELLEYGSQLLDELQENRNPSLSDEQAQTAEVAEDVGNGAEVEADHQDEIGYEDDDFGVSDFNVDFGTTEGGEAEAGVLQAPPNDDPQPDQPANNSSPEAPTPRKHPSGDQEIDVEGQEESINPSDELSNVAEEQAAREETGKRPENNDLAVDDFDDWAGHEQSAINQQDSELDDALEDLSHIPASVPRIEVLYEEGSYSLIGSAGDDPDSYFLSDAKELDRPLSQLLSALRAVISDDVAAADELVIRFDPLDLEFGERSSAKFLSRSFREVLGCHATLCQVPGISADPVIRLTVRRDAEEQFLELLAEAELVKGVPHDAEDSEMSEDLDEDVGNALGEEHVEDEAHKDENSEEYHGGSGEHGVAEHVEGENEPEPETAPGRGDAEVGGDISQAGASAPRASSVTAEPVKSEEQPEDVQAEAHYESPKDGTGEGEAWDEQEAEQGAELEQHAETPVEVSDEQTKGSADHQENDEFLEAEISIEAFDEQTHQPTGQQESDESLEWANLRAEDDAPIPQHAQSSLELPDEQAHGAPEQESSEPFDITVDEAAAPENGGSGQETDANGKYPSFLSPAPISNNWESAATVSSLHRDNCASVLIGEDVSGLVHAPKAGRRRSKASQLPAEQATGPSRPLEPEESWEIDYSDDEYESAPSDRLDDGALSASGPQAHGSVSLGFETKQSWTRAASADSLRTNKTESSGVSMAFSFNTGANNDADQDDDLILAFDEEPALSTIREDADEHEEYAITYEASDFIADEAEDMPELDAAEAANESLSKNSENRVAPRTATETSSVHTSTTINGDEIDYEENAADDGAPQSAAASATNNDEIDWENDEDEYEQQPADEDAGAESEEPKEAALSPPSIAGKRSRTDETESLADETGMLARPSPKRMRMC
jgi:hypothetical protein